MRQNPLGEHPVRRAGSVILFAVLIVVLVPIGTYVWVHHSNNAAAQQLEARLQQLQLPPQTELVDSAWAAQRLAGAGNGMQYAGALLIRSRLDLADLEEFYAEGDGDQHVTATTDERLGRTAILFSAEHDLDQPDLFMVVSMDEPAPESLLQSDLRGH